MNIAVIGSGISGLAAAYYLSQRHSVTLFESETRPGGHTHTVEVPTPQGGLAIDTGFIVCNPVNYPNFYRFLDELAVPRQDTNMSLGVSVAGGRVEWAGDENLLKVFAQPSLLASPTHWRMLAAVARFNADVKRRLAENDLPDITLGEFLERGGYPMSLRLRYVAAMAGPIWSTSTRGVMAFPFPFFARFFDSHGLLNVYQRPQWQTVVGGSQSYLTCALEGFRGTLRLGSPVAAIIREENGVTLRTAEGSQHFDAVICATHADVAANLLVGATSDERRILGAIPYADNEAWLHTDASLMPKRRFAWSSWNALLDGDTLSDAPIGVSYWMNRLQDLPVKQDYIVTLNPPHEPRADTVLYRKRYRHPQYDTAAIAAQKELPGIQGRGGLWWAGAWTRYGFHEDGFTSGLRAAAGIDPRCLPDWARL